jgi:hypothetical protein
MTRSLSLTIAALLASTMMWNSVGHAQDSDKSKDEALDSLLQKLDDAKPANPAKPAAKPADSGSAKAAKAEGAKPAADVAPKDQALDSLLEKLGETTEKPSADDEPPHGPGGPKDEPSAPPPGPKKPEADNLKDKEKEFDQHLEELTGRKRKKKDREQGEGTGPLSDVIKEMRQVEERLGKTDTGEETRKRQSEIVRNLESLIDQMRESSSQSKAKKQIKMTMKQGQQPGSKSGQTPGSNGGQAPQSKPNKPDSKRSLAGGKDEWGHLPPELRQEMDNVFKEEMLPSKEDLIRRYYLSVSKKSLIREE